MADIDSGESLQRLWSCSEIGIEHDQRPRTGRQSLNLCGGMSNESHRSRIIADARSQRAHNYPDKKATPESSGWTVVSFSSCKKDH